MTQGAVKVGDTIVFARADGCYDVLRINVRGQREAVGVGLTDMHSAYITAKVHLSFSGEVLLTDHADPDCFDSYWWPSASDAD